MSRFECRLCHGEKSVVAVYILVLAPVPDLLQRLIIAADAHPVFQEPEFSRAPSAAVRQEHRVRRALPHLDRVHVDPLLVGAHIQKELRRLADPRDRVKRVPPPHDREIGHSIQLKQIRTGHPEEVSHHQIRIPDGLQFGQAVEDIERVPPVSCDLIVDSHRKAFKSCIRIKFHHLYLFQDLRLCQDRLVLGKPDIDDIAVVFDRLLHIWDGKKPKLIEVCDLPYHIVAHADVVQDLIHLRDPALYFVKSCHRGSSFLS